MKKIEDDGKIEAKETITQKKDPKLMENLTASPSPLQSPTFRQPLSLTLLPSLVSGQTSPAFLSRGPLTGDPSKQWRFVGDAHCDEAGHDITDPHR